MKRRIYVKILVLLIMCLLTSTMFTPTVKAAYDSSDSTSMILGVQIPSEQTLPRLSDSQLNFDWVKYQYALGSDQPVESWINNAHNRGFKVLLSIAKNEINIPTLGKASPWTQQYCPYQTQLGVYDWITTDYAGDDPITGDPIYKRNHHHEEESTIWPADTKNGYIQFRDDITVLLQRLMSDPSTTPDAIEIWNEPNLNVEWSSQGLGPVNPVSYANFLACGIKGAQTAKYQGLIISAGLAPLSGSN